MTDVAAIDAFLDRVCRPDAPTSAKPPTTKRPLDKDDTASVSSSVMQKVKKPRQEQVHHGIFITNMPKDADIKAIRAMLLAPKIGILETQIKDIRIGMDKLNSSKSAGWCIIHLSETLSLEPLIQKLDYTIFQDRCIYASILKSAEERIKTKFRLPAEIIADLKQLMIRQQINHSPAGRLSDYYFRRHRKKFPFEMYGFKNFTQALQSIPGVQIVNHYNLAMLHWKI